MYNYIIILSNDASSFLIHLMCLTHPSKLLRERETLSIFERAFFNPISNGQHCKIETDPADRRPGIIY